LLCKLLAIGMITSPIGMNVFVITSVAGNLVSASAIFRGIFWFLVMVVCVVAEAGLRNGASLHYYFGSKDGLICELVRDGAWRSDAARCRARGGVSCRSDRGQAVVVASSAGKPDRVDLRAVAGGFPGPSVRRHKRQDGSSVRAGASTGRMAALTAIGTRRPDPGWAESRP
jgi:hypothetical protein